MPADLRLVRLAELRADESALTGESDPAAKDEIVLPRDTPVADRRNMLYSGTMATSGTGAGIVVATGAETELGEIHRLVSTRTLTENQMTVRTLWTPAGIVEVTGSGYEPEGRLLDVAGHLVAPEENAAPYWSLLGGACCNDAVLTFDKGQWALVGDPTEGAMAVVAAKAGLDRAELVSAHPRLAEIPFSSGRRYMATLHGLSDGGLAPALPQPLSHPGPGGDRRCSPRRCAAPACRTLRPAGALP